MARVTAEGLIRSSVMYGRIELADWTADLANDLLVECEDYVSGCGTEEYWGTLADGSTWRVHLAWYTVEL